MTRLTSADVRDEAARLRALDEALRDVAGADLKTLALRAAGHSRDVLAGVRAVAVPVTTGQGRIGGFSEAVAVILGHLGCLPTVTRQTDVSGMREGAACGAEVMYLADDDCFVALNIREGRCVDNDTATATGYVAALEAAAGGLENRAVLVLGLGPVGLAAAKRLASLGASLSLVEPDAKRLRAALEACPSARPASLVDGLSRCDLILDATPAPGLVTAAAIGDSTIAAVPGIPSGFTREAQAKLGPRHIHDPLAIGVATMAALSFART